MHDVHKHYLTQSINTDIRAVLVAQGPIVNFTGQSEEEVIAFSKAVELAYVLIWTGTTQSQMGKTFPDEFYFSFYHPDMQACPTVHFGIWPPGIVPSPELFAVELCTLLRSIVSRVGGAINRVAQFV